MTHIPLAALQELAVLELESMRSSQDGESEVSEREISESVSAAVAALLIATSSSPEAVDLGPGFGGNGDRTPGGRTNLE